MKRKILIAVDDAGVREALGRVLEEEGYQVLLAADAAEAVEKFQADEIHLLLLDIELPIRDGWSSLERMTSQALDYPIIVLTGSGNQYDLAMASGIGTLMEKPLDVLQLLRTIKELLAESKESRLHRLSSDLSSGVSFSGKA